MLPAVAQGANRIEIRTDDAATAERLAALHCADTGARVAAERALLGGARRVLPDADRGAGGAGRPGRDRAGRAGRRARRAARCTASGAKGAAANAAALGADAGAQLKAKGGAILAALTG